jgi:hypothetical protein
MYSGPDNSDYKNVRRSMKTLTKGFKGRAIFAELDPLDAYGFGVVILRSNQLNQSDF